MLPVMAVVVHVLTVLWLVAGVVGRDFCWALAARVQDLGSVRTMAQTAGNFERAMVRPATLIVLLTGLFAAWQRGWPILGFLQGGAENWVLASILIYLSIVPVILFVFLPRGRIYHRALEAASARGTVTPELRAAINDPFVRAARGYEVLMVATLVLLMVAKPF